MVDDLDITTLNQAAALGVMPNYSQLKGIGITFTNSFVSDSLCCPSRATFLTGMYAHNHGVKQENCRLFQGTNGHESSTIATWLSANSGPNYYTGIVGKYLNGYGSDHTNMDTTDCRDPYFHAQGWDEWHAIDGNPVGTGGDPQQMYNYWIADWAGGAGLPTVNGFPFVPGQPTTNYQTDNLKTKATNLIDNWHRDHSGQPLFLWVTPTAPHLETGDKTGATMLCSYNSPFSPPMAQTIRVYPPYDGMATGQPLPAVSHTGFGVPITNGPHVVFADNDIQQITDGGSCDQRLYDDQLEALKPLDLLLGGIIGHLNQAGVWDNTLLVFTSDNGFFHGEHALQNKVLPYEEAIRVPLVMRYGNATIPNPTVTAPVLNTDFATTFAELAGVCTVGANCNGADGWSLKPYLTTGVPAEWRRHFLLEHWKPLPGQETFPDATSPKFPTYSGIRTFGTEPDVTLRNSMYNEYRDDQTQLVIDSEYYNGLDVTPTWYEATNLRTSCTTICSRLSAFLQAHLQLCGGGFVAVASCQTWEKAVIP